MIINIRGTSGSGKTTLVRTLMGLYKLKTSVREEGRRQPIGYFLQWPRNGAERRACVVGHYETICGGCDTITSMDKIYEYVRQAHEAGNDVLFEGLLISAETRRLIELHEAGLPVMVVGLDKVPLDECLASVNHRRRERMGEEKFKPVNPKNTESKFKGTASSMRRLQEAGVTVHSCDREEALELIRRELGV